ncbi:guanyl-specific ribonuclease F1 [Lojkania enalia]|uniref:ribonuclease T1 n=1 Tax=Lojkania enalia TaxID=147567 RepID=A0A9P4K8S6_9PLEO|nr:guanyl-specific ribonuclease F1 [Didymosphaeria enalia]
MQLLPALLFFLAPITLALPVDTSPIDNPLEIRQSGSITCGSTTYTSSQVTGARNSGYNYVKQGGTAGGSSYPHTYNNYEGFDFLVSGPYYEFPLLKSGAYTGGSPGPDRVIFNGNGQRAGEITHTGASGNSFVGCSGTS